MEDAGISAVIRARELDRALEEAVQTLRSQKLSPFEILIIDSSSSRNLAEWCMLNGCIHVPYPENEIFNYSKAINIGCDKANGLLILIFSQHCSFEDDCGLERMAAQMNRGKTSAVYSKANSPSIRKFKSSTLPLPLASLTQTIWLHNFDGTNGLHNHCSLVDKEAWQLHPFDESLPTCEDQEFAYWHFKNTGRVTISIEGLGLLYRNKYENSYRILSARLICDYYFTPKNFRPSAIVKMLINALKSSIRSKEIRPLLLAGEYLLAIPFRNMIVRKLKSDAKGKKSILVHLFNSI